MNYKRSLNNLFSYTIDRRILYIILSIVIVLVLTLTVIYAALSSTLNIDGNAEVTAASWDIYLGNVQLNSGSVTTNAPIINNKTTATFSTTLSKPGDFYEFNIDVINNGSIDAMIDSITKTPELSATQKKYLKYIVEYQNGKSINTKQLVGKKSFVRLKVRVEFRNDISVSDLPSQEETLNLSFRVNYVQSDETVTNVKYNGVEIFKVINGDLETIGSEVAIGGEHFYIISSNDKSATLLAKYNLYVGGVYDAVTEIWTAYGDEATGLQDPTMKGYGFGQKRNGVVKFSSINYWYDGSSLKSEYGTKCPAYVYDSNSDIYNYVENYKTYLESQGAIVEEARLINLEELEVLGCSIYDSRCENISSWVYQTTYWTGAADCDDEVWRMNSDRYFTPAKYSRRDYMGVRPVIVVKS